MTDAELRAKAASHGPAPLYVPPTLEQALQDERDGLGAVRFMDGRPVWEPGGKVRFS